MAWYNILLVGKSGTGKSTTAIKLLGPTGKDDGQGPLPGKMFTSWEHEVRTMEVSTEPLGERVSDRKEVFRTTVSTLTTEKLTVDRVVYFLPNRGTLEKVDGVLQDDLKVMYHFFGSSIFENMVVAATNHERKQEHGFDDEDKAETQVVVHNALKAITKDEKILCLPVIYIALKDSGKEILEALKSAPVQSDNELELVFREEACAECSVGVNEIGCKADKKKYHPKLVPKYNTLQRGCGGAVHIFTLGLTLFVTNFPWFTNSEKICESCNCEADCEGCTDKEDVD